jgi:hypothetical protein
MCQGHEDLMQSSAEPSGSSTPSGQQSQSDVKKQQKIKIKQQKQQKAKEAIPPSAPPLPTYELVKTGSAKLANGTRYIDVCFIYGSLTVDTLSYLYDNADVPGESKAT